MKELIWAAIVECLDAHAAEPNIDEQLTDAVMQVIESAQPTREPIQYIHHRPTYSDGLYGTGDWVKDQVKMVDVQTAKKMLAHPDVYISGKKEEATETVDPVQPLGDEAPHLDEARQAVMAMRSIKAVAEFVANNFSGAKLEIAKGVGVEGARLEAIRMIDKYHLPHIEA